MVMATMGCGNRAEGIHLLAVLMNATVIPAVCLWTLLAILLFPLAFFSLKATTGAASDRAMRQLNYVYGKGVLGLVRPFVRFKCEGFETHGVRPPCILVVNHQSFFDVYCLALLPFSDVVIAIRAWPFKMVWYAPFMRLSGYLGVERTEWEAVKQAAKGFLRRGAALMFFPEGHRSRDGKLQRFRSGPFQLALETGALIVPVCLSGTYQVLPPGRWWLKPAWVILKALEPIDPRRFSGPAAHRELGQFVRSKMDEVLKEIG
jgi:1-acyl-sn-glycerol-3-phosphate acyltransferase